MKYLGVDYGTKKIGLAYSDDAGVMAFPLAVIPNDSGAHNRIREIAQEKQVQSIVIGHSQNHEGKDNPVMEHIHSFVEELETSAYEVVLEPEFFSTVQAKRFSEDAVADASAAAIILQSYLDRG
tara:strand:- start:6677 stop:7048 length:372 start_codon:yes stop_codon:yes gene_type:complete